MDGIDSVTVTGGSGSFTVTFGGTQAQTNMNQIFGDAADAAIGTATRTITTTYNAADEVTEISDTSRPLPTLATIWVGQSPLAILLLESFDQA